MAQVFAGFVVGYALALLLAPLGAIGLVRSNDRSGLAQRIAPPGTNVVALSVVIHFAAMLVLTAIGMVLGMALAGLERAPRDGRASAARTLCTRCWCIALTAVVVIPLFVIPAAAPPGRVGGAAICRGVRLGGAVARAARLVASTADSLV